MPETRVGVTSTRSFHLVNRLDEAVEIADVLPQRRPAEIVSTAIDSTVLEARASTTVHLAFTPRAAVSYLDTLLVETDEGADVGIRVIGRGKASLQDGLAAHDPLAAEELAAAADEDRTAEARRDAHRGVAPPVETYAEMRAAFAQALDYGRREMWPEAAVLAEAVGDRLRTVTHPQRVLDLVQRYHLGQQAIEVELAMCRDAVFAVEQRTQAHLALAGADYLAAFEQAAADLRVLTGESNDISHLRAFDQATLVTAAGVGIPTVLLAVAGTGGLLLEASPMILSEISLMGYGAQALFQRAYTWIAAHPEEAEAWAEVAVSVGVDAGEDPKGYYERLQTPEGWFQIASDVFLTVYPARAGRGGHEPDPDASGRSTRGATASEPGAPSPARPGATGHTADPRIDHAAKVTHDRLERLVTNVRDAVARGPGAASIYDEAFSANRAYEGSPKHAAMDRRSGGRKIAKEPADGAAAFDFSFPIAQSSPRRIGVDPAHVEFVVFDRTGNKIANKQVVGGAYHGHVRAWDELEPAMKRVLVDHGLVDSRGRMKIDPSRWDNEP